MLHKYLLIYGLCLLFFCHVACARKNITVGIFIDDDEYELSILAIRSAVHRINVFGRTDYLLKPIIYNIPKTDVLKAGAKVCELAQKGVAAIFGPESHEINEIIQSVAQSLEIPQFQNFWNPKLSLFASQSQFREPSTIFNLHPTTYILSKAIATLVKENGWKGFTIIYEDDSALIRLQETLKERDPMETPVTFKKLKLGGNHRSVLKEIKTSGVLHFILDCNVNHILDIFREAKELELLTEYHNYILTNLDSHTLDWSEFRDIKSNITAYRLVNITGSVDRAVQLWAQLLKYPLPDVSQDNMLKLDHWRYKQIYTDILKGDKISTKTALLYDSLNLFITTFSEEDTKETLIVKPLSCEEPEVSLHGSRVSEALRKP